MVVYQSDLDARNVALHITQPTIKAIRERLQGETGMRNCVPMVCVAGAENLNQSTASVGVKSVSNDTHGRKGDANSASQKNSIRQFSKFKIIAAQSV